MKISKRLQINGVQNNCKKRFTNKVRNLLLYLEKAWSEDVAADFILKLDKQIERVHLRPHTGIQIKKF